MVFSGILLSCTPLGSVSIKPDPRRTDRLLSFPIPSCKEDIQSLLGVLGTRQLWLPNISLDTEPFRSLLKKYAHFSWNQDMESALQSNKLKVEGCLTLSPFNPNCLFWIFCDASRVGVGYVFMQVLDDK